MNILETFRTAVEAVVTRRLRSSLTVLGIMIGIAAVVLTVGLGEGAQQQVSSEITALGSNLLTISPGSTTSSSGIRGGFGSASTLTSGDAAALSSKTVAPDVDAVAPTTSESESLVAGTTNWTTTVVGTEPSWLTVRGRSMTEGRFIAGHDVSTRADVVVLGSTTAQELFGVRDAIGQSVSINGVPMSVIGVLNTVGSSGGSSSSTTADQDDQAIVPISTASTQLFGGTSRNSVGEILVQADSSANLSAAYQESDAELLSLHGITTASDADFTITPETSLVSTATSVDRTLTVLLGGIAGISLLVGGIGVMNIMLVSVTERVREIGLRKALGATPRVIRRQFLVEASVLGLAGGLLGAGLGLLVAWILPHFISDPITISPVAMVGAIVVAVGIGVAFGVYPAGRAAKLPPIDALQERVSGVTTSFASKVGLRPASCKTAATAGPIDQISSIHINEEQQGMAMTNAATPSGILPNGAGRRRGSRSVRRALALSVVGTAAALAALGVAGPAFAASSGSGGASGSGPGGGRFPGASGTIAAINGTSLEVQNAQTGQTTVTYTPTTTFQQTVKANASAVIVGSCMTATGKPTKKAKKSLKKAAAQTFGAPVTATVVSITPSTSGTCTTTGFGGGFVGGGAGRFPRAGGSGSGAGGEGPTGQRPNGGAFRGRAAGAFATASGPVTAVSGSKVTIKETNPKTKKASSVVVTLTSSTTFSQRQSAAATDLAVGKCASSFGSADSTGAVTATSITISTPGANGCTTGFGGFGGGGGRAPGGSAGA